MTSEPQKLVYTCDEVSKLLRISRNLTYRLCREKKLPVIFCGKRILCPAKAIDRLLAGDDKPES